MSEVSISSFRNSALCEYNPGAILIFSVGKECKFLYASMPLLILAGFESFEEFNDYFHGDAYNFIYEPDREKIRKRIEWSLDYKVAHGYVEIRLIRKNGEFLFVRSYGRPIMTSDYGPAFIVNMFNCINDYINDENRENTDILTVANMGIWHITLENGKKPKMQANITMQELLGVADANLSQEEVYEAWFSRIKPSALPSVLASLEEMKAGNVSENTYVWIHPTLGEQYVRCGGTAYSFGNGGYVVRGYHYNVTKYVLKQIQEKIRAEQARDAWIMSEERYRTIHRMIKSGMWRIYYDKDGNVANVEWSDEVRKMLGYTDQNDFPNKLSAFTDLIHHDDYNATIKSFEELHIGNSLNASIDLEFRLNTKDKGWRWFHLMGEVVRSSEYTLESLFGVFIDVTVQKEHEALEISRNNALIKAKKSEEALNSVYASLKSGRWVINYDDDGKITSFEISDNFANLLGFPRKVEKDVKEWSFWLKRVHHDDFANLKKEYYDTLNGEHHDDTYNVKFRFMTMDRGFRWFLSIGKIVRRENGVPGSFYGLFIDIDDETIAEQKLVSLRKEKDEQLNVLLSMSQTYNSMHIVDLRNMSVQEYFSTNDVRKYVNTEERADVQMKRVMLNLTSQESRSTILEFCDINTLAVRMKNRSSMSCNFLSNHNLWFRATFTVVDRDSDGSVVRVMFTTILVDEEKRKEDELIKKTITDELTGLLNRRCYEENVASFTSKSIPERMIVLSLDVNGLKQINDTMGHSMGDELLKGASFCIKSVFGGYGSVYRIGGDEFAVIIEADKTRVDMLMLDLEQVTSNWKGNKIESLSISCGYAIYAEHPTWNFKQLEKLADDNMYLAKRDFYNSRIDN